MFLSADDHLKSARLNNNDNLSKQVKNNVGNCYSLLQLFVENAWEKEEIVKLADWLSRKRINVNNKNWFLLLRPTFVDYKRVQINDTNKQDAFKTRIAYELQNVLPLLLKCNDNVNFTNNDGQTILHVFLANNESDYKYSPKRIKLKILQIVNALIDKGASVNAVDKSGKTPVHNAAETRKYEIITLMLDFFTNVNACDEQGNTVLHTVVNKSLGNNGVHAKECVDIVRSLLSKGANPNRKNEKGMTPVQLAANKYNVELLQIFKENDGDFNVLTENGENLLLLVYRDHWYVGSDESKIAKTIDFLVNQGCDVNIKDKDGYSPLHYASQWDRTVERLIELGSDVNCQTKEGLLTPLHLATLELRSKKMKFQSTNKAAGALLRAGAYRDAVDYRGRTPLHYVLERKNVEMLKCFLQFGADINDHDMSNLVMNCSEDLKNLVFIHAATLRAIGFPLAKVYESYLNKPSLKNNYEECMKEVNKLKRYMISNEVSIYKFLHMNLRRQLVFAEYLPRNLASNFPIYHNFIQAICREAIQRNQLLEPAKLAWYQITKINLPDICVERILYFLNNWGLKALIDTAEKDCHQK